MKPSVLIIFIYLALSATILILFNGTGGEADSINHYLHAKYAFQHPELFLNHWAKPFFTLLLSPFAQFGFIGAKIFNVACSLVTIYFTYQIAHHLKLKHAYLASLFLFVFPLSFVTTFSGLTEPSSAALLSFAIYLTLKKYDWQAAIIISFLPFVRSEGLLFIIVFSSYWIVKWKWKILPFILTGHLIYSIIGFFHYGDFLWVFNKIPYATLNSHYGEGRLLHFAEKLIYISGVPLLIFFLAGLIRSIFKSRKKQQMDFFFLILCNFFIFFLAHSLFWYLGIFNSMGLKRVFAAVTPLMAIICLYGFNLIELINHKLIKNAVSVICLTYILIFPFTSNPAAIDWEKEMNLTAAENTAEEVSKYIERSGLANNRFVYTDPYLAEALQIDPFDHQQRLILSEEALLEVKKGDLIIWDNWHAVTDYGIELSRLKSYKEIKKFQNEQATYVLFQVN